MLFAFERWEKYVDKTALAFPLRDRVLHSALYGGKKEPMEWPMMGNLHSTTFPANLWMTGKSLFKDEPPT